MPTLAWLTRDDDIKTAAAVPYRLLEAVPELDGGGENDRSENLLIQGDNLHALKALLPYYAGRVKCVFIDPPCDMRQGSVHCGDNPEHTQWFETMHPFPELWRALLAGDGSIRTKETGELSTDDVSTTPEAEEPIQRVLQLATDEGDWVLDSFLGSGTTAAVAHKMGRRWIGIERDGRAVTHCVRRLNAVIDGEQGGVSRAVGWKGGGGFGFYKVGVEAFTADGEINPDVTFPTLASHVWFCETGTPWSGRAQGAFLGANGGTGYALLYHRAPGERQGNGGNVLTRQTLDAIRVSAGAFSGPLVIYAADNHLGDDYLKRENIRFKQTPCEVGAW